MIPVIQGNYTQKSVSKKACKSLKDSLIAAENKYRNSDAYRRATIRLQREKKLLKLNILVNHSTLMDFARRGVLTLDYFNNNPYHYEPKRNI